LQKSPARAGRRRAELLLAETAPSKGNGAPERYNLFGLERLKP
jgi:hypothetical protein